jgi:DNA-binding SARP family transcriptional activator
VTTAQARRPQPVTIELFGGCTIRGSAVDPVRVGGRAAVALARLAMAAGAEVSRDELGEAVWGEAPPASWLPALRNVVAELRRALDRAGSIDALVATQGGYRLQLAPGSTVDVAVLEANAERSVEALRNGDEVTALHCASIAVDVSATALLMGAETQWVEGLRRRVEELREGAALAGSRAALAMDDLHDAQRLAEVAVAVSPLGEDGYRLLMQALAVSGNRGAAVSAYERLRQILERELLIRPSEQTEQLAHAVLGNTSQMSSVQDAPSPGAAWRRSVDYGLRVSRAAFAAAEFDDVIAMSNRSLIVLNAAGDPDPRLRLDLLTLLGAAQRAVGQQVAFPTLEAAVSLARELGDGERLADVLVAFTQGGAAADEHYVDHTLRELYDEALAALPDPDPRRRAPLLAHAAVGRAFASGGQRVIEAADDAVRLARGLGEPVTLLAVLSLVRRAIWGRFDLARQERLEDEILEMADLLDDPAAQASALLWRFMTRIEQGRGEELEATLDAAGPVVAGLRMGHYHHTLAYSRAALAMLRGNFAEAEQQIEHAAQIGRRRGLSGDITEALRLAQLTGLREEQGRLPEIRDEAVGLYAGASQPLWLGMVAVVEAATGNDEKTVASLRVFLRTYRRRGPTLLAPVAMAAFAAIPTVHVADRTQAKALYDLIAPHAGRGGYFAYFSGPIDLYLGLLARHLDRHDEAERHLGNAVTFCEHIGAPVWAARCRDLLRPASWQQRHAP